MFKFKTDLFAALKVRNYRLFFMGQGVSLIGTWMQRTTMGWYVYRLTHSAFLLGLVGFLSMIPSLFISPFAGAWADKWNRHQAMVITQIMFMLQASLLAFFVLGGWITSKSWWPLIVLALMQGAIEGIDSPLRQHFVLDLVTKRSLLPNAIATNSAMFNAARLVGPSVGGALILLFSEGVCFAFNAFSYLTVIVALLMMKIKYPPRQKSQEPIMHQILDGWKYSWQNFPIRFLIANLSVFMLLAMSYAAVIPVFAKDILHGNAGTQGILLSMAGVGALISSFYMAGRKTIKGLPLVSSILACVASLALISFAQSKNIWLSLALMLIIGMGMTIQMSSTNTLIQSVVEPRLRGRVLSVYTMAFNSLSPFGSLLIGFLARQFGARIALTITAVISLLWSLNGLRLMPQLIKKILRMLVINKNTESYRPLRARIEYTGVEG
jgi:MFS family permease